VSDSIFLINRELRLINTMPITGLSLHTREAWGDSKDFDFVIHDVEGESSYSIENVMRTTSYGSEVKLGDKFECNIYLPYNHLTNNIITNLHTLGKRYAINILLGGQQAMTDVNSYEVPEVINATAKGRLFINDTTLPITICRFKIESIELRPRIILTWNLFIKNYNSSVIYDSTLLDYTPPEEL